MNEQEGLPEGGIKNNKGEFVEKEIQINLPLASAKIIPHKGLSKAIRPNLDQMRENRLNLYKLEKYKSNMRKMQMHKVISTLHIDPKEFTRSQQEQSKSYKQYFERKVSDRKKTLAKLAGIQYIRPCRYRNVTIKECLTQVCSLIDETIPIYGNWRWSAGEDIAVSNGSLPRFTLNDCVTPGNGYTLSDGWLWIGVSIQMTRPTKIKQIGVTFEGSGYYDADGEDHWYGDEWGRVRVWTELEIGSINLGGPLNPLISESDQRVREINSRNSSGPTSAHPWLPDQRHVNLDLNVLTNHVFTIDYTLSYQVKRSDDYNASACFGFTNLVIRPYVVIEECQTEYRITEESIAELLELIQ